MSGRPVHEAVDRIERGLLAVEGLVLAAHGAQDPVERLRPGAYGTTALDQVSRFLMSARQELAALRCVSSFQQNVARRARGSR